MKDVFESDAERIFAHRLMELCLDNAAYGLSIDLAEEVYDVGYAYSVIHFRCKSPIEQMLGAGLAFANDGRARLRWEVNSVTKFMTKEHLEGRATIKQSIISPQVQIGEYRVDFLIATRTPSNEVVLTALECDGHDFHERTKEQASRDKQRDRILAAKGITTLRFTGSDIHHRLDECIDEIQDYLAGTLYKRGAAA